MTRILVTIMAFGIAFGIASGAALTGSGLAAGFEAEASAADLPAAPRSIDAAGPTIHKVTPHSDRVEGNDVGMAMLFGENKIRSGQSMARSGMEVITGYGGHFRAVQGFRYLGEQ